ncbi:MAG: hypothetical protein ABUL64_04280 [Singulisphaera sp.]
MTASEHWRLDGPRAFLSCGDLSAQVDIAHPGEGLQEIRLRGLALRGAQLLAARFAGDQQQTQQVVADAFVRGRDLVVTYAQEPEHPVRVQIYWRVVPEAKLCPGAVGVDLQVSVQTSLLHAWPALAICSYAPTAWEVVTCGNNMGLLSSSAQGRAAACWRSSWPQTNATYFEMVHPADVEKEELAESAEGAFQLSHQLFAESLEKGVILRARARGIFTAEKLDAETVASVYERFLIAPLPLTT